MYRVFDETGRLIYVGQSKNLPNRVREHRSQSWWWEPLVTRVQVELHPTAEAAKAAEKTAIQEETPVFNSMGYGDWRDKPYWTQRDHDLYFEWYRQNLERRDRAPGFVDHMLETAFPERFANRELWAVA